MAKSIKKTSISKANEIGISFEKFIPEKYRTPALLLLILLLIIIFFSPIIFGDKTTQSGDLIQAKSLRAYAMKDRDTYSLWNPYIFCGLPAVVTSAAPRWFDLTSAAYSTITLVTNNLAKDFNAAFIISFILLGYAGFFLMRGLGFNRGPSLYTALALAFSTGIMILFFIGHVSKLKSLAIFPFILMMLFKFQKQIKLIDILLLILGIHLLAISAHVQIVFYFMLVTGLYFFYFLIRSFIIKDKFLQKQLFKSICIFAGATIIALLMSFDTYSQLVEYKPYSTRGTQSVTETDNTGAAQNNSYEYNTGWSFSPGEVLTFIVPSYYGFGNSIYNGPLTENQDQQVDTYFGQMTTVDSAMYMGIIIFALGLFALIVKRKDPIVQFLGFISVLFIFMSFGKNFPIVFNLFYYYFPMFNNFRTPSMILHVVQIIFPILAGFGVASIISLRDEKNINVIKALKYTAITFTALFFVFLLLSDTISSWFSQRVTDYASTIGQNGQYFTSLSSYITEMFKNDLLIAAGLLALAFGLSYFYTQAKINKDLLVGGLIILSLFDLFRISNRPSSYIDVASVNEIFKQPNYISVIKQQNDKGPYRLLNLKQDKSFGTLSQNANFNVNFLQEDFFGYSAAKPRSYQDIIDVVGPVNMTLWRMLNVKYIVTDSPYNPPGFVTIYTSKKEFVYRNDKALPRVYFVDDVRQASTPDMLKAIKDDSFDPKKLAYVEKLDFKFDKGDSTSSAIIDQYKDELISVSTNSKGNNFLFFNATYLPSWRAFIDGTATKTYKTNHGFIGIVVPQGNHKVEFKYEPKGFAIGRDFSLILNILLFGGIGFVFLTNKRNQKKSIVK